MSGLTTAQSKPPFPHPRGGIAIDVIPSCCTFWTKATNPLCISSILDLPFQWRLVGKLIMYLGLNKLPVGNINIRPGCTSPFLQAFS